MNWSITHIVPFDIGYSFVNYRRSNQQVRERIINSLKDFCESNGYEIFETQISKCFFNVKFNENISCFLLEYGIGIFVVKNIKEIDLKKVKEKFEDNISCVLYYSKQKEQKLILECQSKSFEVFKIFMKKVWSLINTYERPYSASEKYKYAGFSYVFSIYHIIDPTENLLKAKNENIDLLMNPSIIHKLYDETQWDVIKTKILDYNMKGYNLKECMATSVVASSWSAVAVIENEETEVIEKIINYEINAQASWFLFDCLVDNINKSNMTNLDLQKEKSLATNVSLDMSIILSANMSLSEKNVLESIFSTTGFEALRDKLFLLLENRIAIAEAKISERQVKYGIVTEILLVLFTLVSIYEPIKNLISGSLQTVDIVLGIFMIIIFIICSIMIIRREK
ncbi:hypothetical protein KST04_06900 [Fusobacterium vincentii]|uniref:Uncharacterized protein n=1 Tax=Fusobacterium nucleatum TaxID=851 RepID=A0AAX3MD06_FUSNU|nr:hypothetical protein [Fusobacterium nucleatum]ATV07003.1 hypothetical protein CS401_09985 [Fusobacterium vincentii]MCG6837488.1 hypothetical protein [Fusobacterium nucleatum]QYR57270.1 hypothetical protein JY399_01345 [Fusobacterium vincentii]WDA44594.1 hypothetical protein PSR69_03110 [Fusobacterium nucleatum]